MGKLDQIIGQLQSQVTKHTELFNDSANIRSISVSGTTVTIEVDTELNQDTVANIRDVYVQNNAVSASAGDVSGTYIVELEQEHDVTYSELEIDLDIEKTVEFVGDFEGDRVLVGVPELDQVTIESSLAPTGSYYLLENYNVSGRKTITWINSTTFTYESDYELTLVSNNGTVQNNIRVDGISSDNDLSDLLENKAIKLTKNTMFVVMNEARASKSRHIYSDAYNRKEYKDDLHIEVPQTFSVFIVIPTHTKTTPREAINSIDDLRVYMVKSLHGALFDSGFVSNNKFLCSYLSDTGEQYNKAYYVHRFDFETVFNIENEDSVAVEDTRAFKSFEIGFKMEYDDYEEEKKSIEDNLL